MLNNNIIYLMIIIILIIYFTQSKENFSGNKNKDYLSGLKKINCFIK